MYHRYFGLKEAPFSIAVNPRYLYMSPRHRDALAHLIYGVGVGSGEGGGGFILLTGEVGTGKTTINRCLLEQLPENTDIALILNPALNAIELLATACDELGIAYKPGEQSLKVLTDKLHQFLLSNHAHGRNTVLLIDEAQHLQFEVLEQVRLLTNLETNTKKLLQIILVGQPELRTLLNKPELRQLAQRITARYQLKPLSVQETQDYIRHRLHVAGLPANQELFPFSVVKGIHKVSRGVPRIINVLCDRMLLGTYGKNKTVVDKAMLNQAIGEVMGEDDDLALKPPTKTTPIIASIICIGLVALAWLNWPSIVEKDTANPVNNQITSTPVITKEVVIEKPIVNAEKESDAVPSTDSPWTMNNSIALSELVSAIGLKPSPEFSCFHEKLRCETLTVDNWQELKSYNRPAILALITPGKMLAYATLLTIDGNQATLSHQGESVQIPLEKLGALWTGEFTFVWQPPTSFEKPISLNDEGPMVTWLAEQFAILDGQTKRLAGDVFNMALTRRVKIFQDDNQLKADGVAGLKTLLKINELLGIDKTLSLNSNIRPEG